MFLYGCRGLTACGRFLRLPRVDFSSIPDLTGLNLVRSVDKTIDRNSSIFVESPIHLRVIPIHETSDTHDKLVMELYSREKLPRDFNVKQSSKRLELVNTASSSDRSDVCVLRVPLNLSINLIASLDACVEVGNILADDVAVCTQKGNVNLGNIRAKYIKVESSEGALVGSGRLEASSVELKTGFKSGIKCNNIMSNDLKVTTHAGDISVESCYSGTSHFTTALGNICLHHIQNYCTVDVIQQGSLHIGGLEGSLKASLKSGDVFVLASRLLNKSTIFVHEKGHVEMRLAELVENLSLNLIGGKVNVEEEIKKLGRYMDDSDTQRFRFPLDEKEAHNIEESELTVDCRNGVIELKKSKVPFLLKSGS